MTWRMEELLPHAPPMVLLDRVLHIGEDSLRAVVTVRSDSMFFHPNRGVPAHVGLEWMAQACGAFAGMRAKAEDKPVALGFLLGTRRYVATQPWFADGEQAVVAIRRMFEEDGLASFDCDIEIASAQRATARLVVFQPADPAIVLNAP